LEGFRLREPALGDGKRWAPYRTLVFMFILGRESMNELLVRVENFQQDTARRGLEKIINRSASRRIFSGRFLGR
jgi:hypothetical protein